MRRILVSVAAIGSALALPPAVDSATVDNTLTIVRQDGSRIEAPLQVKVACHHRRGFMRVIAGRFPNTYWYAEIALPVRRRVIELPHERTFPRPRDAFFFAFDARTEQEHSSAQEESRGRIVLERVRCRPRPAVAFRIEAQLDSEVSDATAVVTGRVEARGHRPR